MRRRELLTFLGTAPVWLSGARAQRSMPVVGFLNPASPNTYNFAVAAFRDGLAKAGFVEGRNVGIEYRWGNGDYNALPELARDLVAKNVAAIAATGDVASARAAQSATPNIPIVFTIGADPVRHGLVASLNRPGANVTGVNLFSSILSGKRVGLLTETATQARRIALLMNPSNFTAEAEQRQAQDAASALGREAFVVNISNPGEVEGALAEIVRLKGDSYVTASDPLILDRRGQILQFAQQHALPGIGFVRQYAVAGALLSYGPSITWMYVQAGFYVGQVLKGVKPADLPVMQPTEFETVINLKIAKVLGIEPPPVILAQASEVIE